MLLANPRSRAPCPISSDLCSFPVQEKQMSASQPLGEADKRGYRMNESSIAIITARGGSKRIPRKNIKEFCGKPIITYSIEAALHSGLFTEVMVSTDDEEIARIAEQAGAKVPFGTICGRSVVPYSRKGFVLQQ